MSNVILLGFVRLSGTGKSIKISLNVDAIDNAIKNKAFYTSKKHGGMIPASIKLDTLRKVMDGEKEATALVCFEPDEGDK